jgi:hypothetical protein
MSAKVDCPILMAYGVRETYCNALAILIWSKTAPAITLVACIWEACASNRSRVAAYHNVFLAFSQSLPENSWIVLQIRPRLLPSTFPFNLQMILPVDNIPGVTGQTNLGPRALGGTFDKSRVFLCKFQCSVATLLIA